jgi:hypothetical protein
MPLKTQKPPVILACRSSVIAKTVRHSVFKPLSEKNRFLLPTA